MEKTQVETTEVETVEVETEVFPEEVKVVEEGSPKKTLDEVLDQTNETMDKLQQDLERREKELFEREMQSSLKGAGLEKFQEIINVKTHEELDIVMTKLTAIMNEMKIENSYQPTDNAKQDSYTQAIQSGDVKNAINFKLANLFGKK